ncbi:MAG: serine hydrolase domain-containing protein [Limisphaerales bacterium]
MKFHRRAFIKCVGLGAAGLGLVSSFPGCLSRRNSAYGSLPRSTPEEQGVSSAGILAFLDAAAKSPNEFHSFMMVRHGRVIAEGWWAPYRPGANHMLYSLSKSFTSTAVGFAVTEGRFTVDDPVVSFFPDELPSSVSDHLAALRVKHLLTMSVGHATDSTPRIVWQEDWVKAFLALPIENPPGSAFLYNSGATYMLSAIVQKVSGQKAIDYLRPRLFQPLDIHGMAWETCPRGINTGGWGLAVKTEALASFGQFYLQKGVWQGRQLLPAAWVQEATTFKIQQPAGPGEDLAALKKTSPWHQGYCYQFWRCRHNAFRGDGAFGQFSIVMPDQDAVVVITSESPNMKADMDMVWDHLLPAISGAALPADPTTEGELRNRLASLSLPLPKSQAPSPTADRISGKTFQIEPNDAGVRSVSFQFPQNGCAFYLTDGKGQYAVQCGLGKWVDGLCSIPGTPPKITVGNLLPCKLAASAAWKDENTLEMIWRYYETPHHDTVTCHFQGNTVSLEFMSSIPQPQHKETRLVLRGQA